MSPQYFFKRPMTRESDGDLREHPPGLLQHCEALLKAGRSGDSHQSEADDQVLYPGLAVPLEVGLVESTLEPDIRIEVIVAAQRLALPLEVGHGLERHVERDRWTEPTIGAPHGALHHPAAQSTAEQPHRFHRRGRVLDERECIEAALVGGRFAGPQLLHHVEDLVGSRASGSERLAEHIELLLHPPGADPKQEPPPAEVLDRERGVGCEKRVSDGEGQGAAAEVDGGRRRRHRREQAPNVVEWRLGGVSRLATVVVWIDTTKLERRGHVVADPDRLPAGLLGGPRDRGEPIYVETPKGQRGTHGNVARRPGSARTGPTGPRPG